MTALECLFQAGDIPIAAERSGMSELEFSRLLVQCNPHDLAECLRAAQLLGAFRTTRQVEAKIQDAIRDDAIPLSLLFKEYPNLVRLLPELAAAPIHVQATQNNFEVTAQASSSKLPAHILAALQALGITGEPEDPQDLEADEEPSEPPKLRIIEH